MIERSPSKYNCDRLALLIFLIAFLLRAWNIGADLPNLYMADEPHHLNIAAYFGTGDLNPHDFKYPTLWSYMLALLFGLMFGVGKILGLAHSTADFAGAFFYSPTIFYVSARMLAVLLFSLASAALYFTGKRFYDTATGVAAALFLALAPNLFLYGRDATLHGPMVFFICCALYFLHAMLEEDAVHNQLLAGLCLGLAISSHYIAAPAALLLPVLHILKYGFRNNRGLIVGCSAVVLGVFIGSPFLFIDFRKAHEDLTGMGHLHMPALGQHDHNELARRPYEIGWQFREMVSHATTYLDSWRVGFLLLLVGLFSKPGRQRWINIAWLVPAFAIAIPMLAAYHGTFPRYWLSAYIVFIVLSATGFSFLWNKAQRYQGLQWAFALIVFLPMTLSTIKQSKDLVLPDARTLAQRWISEHVPANTRVLITDPFNCPQLPMARQQIEDLLERTTRLHHPRAAYYKALLHDANSGGYVIYYFRRSLTEVEDLPERTRRAFEAMDTLDLAKDGFQAILQTGINVVSLDPRLDTPSNHDWIEALRHQCTKQLSLHPDFISMKGPPTEIYTCGEMSQPQKGSPNHANEPINHANPT